MENKRWKSFRVQISLQRLSTIIQVFVTWYRQHWKCVNFLHYNKIMMLCSNEVIKLITVNFHAHCTFTMCMQWNTCIWVNMPWILSDIATYSKITDSSGSDCWHRASQARFVLSDWYNIMTVWWCYSLAKGKKHWENEVLKSPEISKENNHFMF